MYVDPRCHHRVRKEDFLKEGGGRQCPGRYGEQTYRGEAKETEAEQRHGRGGQGRKERGDMEGSSLEKRHRGEPHGEICGGDKKEMESRG